MVCLYRSNRNESNPPAPATRGRGLDGLRCIVSSGFAVKSDAFSNILTPGGLVVKGVLSRPEIAFTPPVPVGTFVGVLAVGQTISRRG
jgi:hypothetical protein